MPVRLSTTLSKIPSVPNSVNADLLDGLYHFMKSTGASESHCNNTLKSSIAFARFLGPDQSFYDIRIRDEITGFLDTKIKDNVTDPEKKWITTWNDYLGDLKYLFRWLHNYKLKVDQGLEPDASPSEWETWKMEMKLREIRNLNNKANHLYICSGLRGMQLSYNFFFDTYRTFVERFRDNEENK
jgi:hypothetical protein